MRRSTLKQLVAAKMSKVQEHAAYEQMNNIIAEQEDCISNDALTSQDDPSQKSQKSNKINSEKGDETP